jgi:uncharacterized protein YjdB
VEWATSDERVASVTPLGKGTARVSAGAGGQAQITATVTKSIAQAGFLALLQGGPKKSPPKATATVRVGPADVVYVSGGGQAGEVGSTLPRELVVRAVDGNGKGVPNVEIEFVPNPNHGTLAPAKVMTDEEGRARSRWTLGAAAGKMRAESRTHNRLKLAPIEFTATATATEGSGAPASVAVTPTAVKLNAIGDTVELSAVVRDSQGNALAGQSVTWSSRNSGIASVDAAGRVIAKKAGRAQIVAAVASVVDSAVVDVKQLAAAVTVTPGSATITLGDSRQFTAAVTDSNGVAISEPTVSWSSSHPDVATVDGAGRVTTLKAGSTSLTATSDKASGTAAVTVEQPVAPPPPPLSGILPAFPGAEGWGAAALNECRSLPLVVHKVTNTNDSGTGSFRDIIMNRTRTDRYDVIIFTTGGLIQIQQIEPTARQKCVYIAGQTAPGGGISFRGHKIEFRNLQDGVIRHLRHRGGHSVGFRFRGQRIIADHLTVSWTGAPTASSANAFSFSPGVSGAFVGRDYTIQNSLIYEPSEHPTLLVVNSGSDGWIERVSAHRNVLLGPGHRMPKCSGGGDQSYVNNVFYNWTSRASGAERAYNCDFINNYYKPGPATGRTQAIRIRSGDSLVGTAEELNAGCSSTGAPCHQSLYVSGNRTPANNYGATPADPWSGPNRDIYCNNDNASWCPGSAAEVPAHVRARIKRDAPLPAATPFAVTVHAITDGVRDAITGVAGHSRALACDGSWRTVREAIDQERINWFYAGTGWSSWKEYNTLTMPYSAPPQGSACADADGDGLPDAWELRFFGSTTAANPATVTPSGYLVIEHYLNGTTP